MSKFKEGDRVLLPEDELNPVEIGTIIGVEGEEIYIVQLDPEYCHRISGDDGIREVPEEQMTELS